MTGTLATALCESLTRRIGSSLHLELAALVRDARKRVIAGEGGRGLRALSRRAPWTVESNLDLIAWPAEPLWIETAPYEAADDRREHDIGFLLFRVPDSDFYAAATAVRSPAAPAQHAFAVALLDPATLAAHAGEARRKYSKTPDESLERLMGVIGVTMAEEFVEELRLLDEGGERMVDAAMRDATAEIPLLLATLLSIGASGCFIEDHSDESLGAVRLEGLPRPTRTRFGRFADGLRRRQSSGFIRTGGRKPRLRWFD